MTTMFLAYLLINIMRQLLKDFGISIVIHFMAGYNPPKGSDHDEIDDFSKIWDRLTIPFRNLSDCGVNLGVDVGLHGFLPRSKVL